MPSSDTWFKKGSSGNPAGRKPGRESARDAVRRELLKPIKGGGTKLTEWGWLKMNGIDPEPYLPRCRPCLREHVRRIVLAEMQ